MAFYNNPSNAYIKFEIKQHVINTKYSRMFRCLSRDVSGSSFDIPADNKVFFGYANHPFPNTLVAVMSISLANMNLTEATEDFCCDYFHHISFLFVKKDYQGQGYGKRMLQRALRFMRQHNSKRPVRVQSAGKSVGFFLKENFRKVGELYEAAATYDSPALFNKIQNMERQL